MGMLTVALCVTALFLLSSASCPKKLPKSFNSACLRKGFATSIPHCESAEVDQELNTKARKKCEKMERSLLGCGYDCRPECPKKLKSNFASQCLKKGFNSRIDGCRGTSDASLSDEKEQQCLEMEAKLAECGHTCEAEAMRPDELLERCAHQNVEFYGGDMFNRMYNDIRECIRDCQKSKSCLAITYRSDDRCYFKSSKGGERGPRFLEGAISVNMEGCVRRSSSFYDSCIRDGFYYNGGDLGGLRAVDITQCFHFCEDTENCKAISFRESDGYCWLKDETGGGSGPSSNPGHLAANIACEAVRFDRDCIRNNINFPGSELRNFAVADIEECAQHCRDTERCKSLTFRVSDQRCYLKHKFGGDRPTIQEAHHSMNMECNNRPVNNLDCMREGIVFNDGDIGNIVVESVEECVMRCRDAEDCKAITLRQTDNVCFLKNRDGGYSGPTKVESHASMNLECNNRPIRNKGCRRQNTNFPGADIRNIMVEDIDECIRYCRDTERCKSISLLPVEGALRCYLKYRRGGGSVPVEQAGWESMNMECDNSDPGELVCLRENIDFRGADIGHTVVTNERECFDLCRDTEDCVGFSFRESDGRCHAKNRRGGGNVYKEIGMNSLNMVCDEIPIRDSMECLRYDIAYSGADLSSHLIVADERECLRHCGDTTDCVAMTFRESDHRCYLKNKLGGHNGGSIAPGHNSANLVCENTRPPQLQCNTIEERFSGHDMHHVRVENMEECLRLCRDAGDCQAVSFRLQDHVCEMKRATFEWWSIQSHYLSLNMDCSEN